MDLNLYKQLSNDERKIYNDLPRTAEEQESFDILKKQFEEEVQNEVAEFEGSDRKIDQIITETGLQDPADVKNVEQELDVKKNLSLLNKDAETLKKESVGDTGESTPPSLKIFTETYCRNNFLKKEKKQVFPLTSAKEIEECATVSIFSARYSGLQEKFGKKDHSFLQTSEGQAALEQLFVRSLHRGEDSPRVLKKLHKKLLRSDFFKSEEYQEARAKYALQQLSKGSYKTDNEVIVSDEDRGVDELFIDTEKSTETTFERSLVDLRSKYITEEDLHAKARHGFSARASSFAEGFGGYRKEEVLEYKNSFGISGEEMKQDLTKAVLAFAQNGEFNKIERVQKEFSDISAVADVPGIKEVAREGILKNLAKGDYHGIKKWFDAFSFPETEIESEDMQAALAESLLVQDDYNSLAAVTETVRLCTQSTRDKIFKDEKACDAVAVYLAHYLAGHSHQADAFNILETEGLLPQELVSQIKRNIVAFNMIGRRKNSRDDRDVVTAIKSFQVNSDEVFSAATTAYLDGMLSTGRFHSEEGVLTQLKEEYLSEGLSTDPSVVKAFQEKYLESLEEGRGSSLSGLKELIPAEFFAIDKAMVKKAVETGILSALAKGDGLSAKVLSEEFYPETHNFFVLSDECRTAARDAYQNTVEHFTSSSDMRGIQALEKKFLWTDPEAGPIKKKACIHLLEEDVSRFETLKYSRATQTDLDYSEQLAKEYFSSNSQAFIEKQLSEGRIDNIAKAVECYPKLIGEEYEKFVAQATAVAFDEQNPSKARELCVTALKELYFAGRPDVFRHLSKLFIQEMQKEETERIDMKTLYPFAANFANEARATQSNSTIKRALSGKDNNKFEVEKYKMSGEDLAASVLKIQETLLASNDPLIRYLGLKSISQKPDFSLRQTFEIRKLSEEMPEELKRFAKNDEFINEALIRHLKILAKETPETLTKDNWAGYLYGYAVVSEHAMLHDEKERQSLLGVFESDSKRKDECLRHMQDAWKEYLQTGKMSLELATVSDLIHKQDSAGNMKMIESLGLFAHDASSVGEKETTAERTKSDLNSFLKSTEERFAKEKWSEAAKTSFYDISRELMNAAPALFVEFSSVIEKLSPAEFKSFFTEIYPLYRARLLITQKQSTSGFKSHPKELVAIRNEVRTMGERLGESGSDRDATFADIRSSLNASFSEALKSRFGLIKEQESMNETKIKTLQNAIQYIGTVAGRDARKETIISSFMALTMDGKWEKFRAGANTVDIPAYFNKEKAEVLKPILEKRTEVFETMRNTAGISKADEEAFNNRLQGATTSTMVGNIMTIDEKVGTVKRNIDELADPDLYQGDEERGAIKLLRVEGKRVQGVLAKAFALSSGKEGAFTDDEARIEEELRSIYGVREWTKDSVKGVQDKIRPYSLISDVVTRVNDQNIEGKINDLQVALSPSDALIEIFARVGEEFQQTSGALALSQDLSYLENIIVKNQHKFSEQEKKLVEEYLTAIRTQMQVLEKAFLDMKEYVAKVSKSSHATGNSQLKEKMSEIEKLISAENSVTAVVTEMSSDMNFFIENIRACLSCKERGANNDTNLSFGEPTKFFIASKTESNTQTVADQLAYFYPSTDSDGSSRMSFVLDRIYGNKSGDMLVAHTMNVYKKYKQLKEMNPEAKIDIIVSKEALLSCGATEETFKSKITQLFPDSQMSISSTVQRDVDVLHSEFSDPYIEFGNMSPRETGVRGVEGLIIS